ncbi:hypothetical protein WOLCODRAFT_94323 [Wolfiporia cocos MD-104 SS10]|uniref:Zn(2)-C6 fungal-type domain-containing protein n=1 Tax=Wolfiporia cocos (strain MD-104) TaxID=742152 RepID=A0A2H3J882_WOLCO|nr:hypothetical protein WOLCODRAFT_94323 [Wolfiporia cocos MD-104 SS10]
MPKAASPSQAPKQTFHPHASVLKRNQVCYDHSLLLSDLPNHHLFRVQACHKCRKRKLKCDAKRPCTTCERSHRYQVAHAPAGSELPPHPDCTYDEVTETDSSDPFENPKARFERLESRINELETLLHEKDKAQASQQANHFVSSQQQHGAQQGPNMLLATNEVPSAYTSSTPNINTFNSGATISVDPTFAFQQFQSGTALDNLAGVASLIGTAGMPSPASRLESLTAASGSPTAVNETSSGSASSETHSPDHCLDILYSAWPKNLPGPLLLRHLVDAFFIYHPDANRMFHQPTFLSTLTLPPTHPNFPITALLHAICAVGSMYTAELPRPLNPTSPEFSPYDIFPDKYKAREGIEESFSESQAKFAKMSLDAAMDESKELFQNVQALILLSWWLWYNAKWAEAFLTTSHALRYSLPCALNVCRPFHAIAEVLRPSSLLPPPRNAVEGEVRRNVFWIGYALERVHGTGNAWAMTIDDQDIAQLLPLRRDQFDQGVLVAPIERQFSHDADVLLTHPEDQTDPFILYVKSAMLLSRVKNFNLRFRSRHHAGDPAATVPPESKIRTDAKDDTRATPAFIELDRLVTLFKASIPGHLRNPVSEQVDPHLFSAWSAAHLAEILLHEPHAVVGQSTCTSSCKILSASRQILDMVYIISSTSYDLPLLGLSPIICWFMAGRVLVRFLRVAIDCNSEEMCNTLRQEVNFLQSVIFRVGQQIPLAHRYGKMLHDFVVQICGAQYDTTTTLSVEQGQGYHAIAGGNM